VRSLFLGPQHMEKTIMPAGSYATIGSVAERFGIPRWRLVYLY
jgi:hypothetical protein